VTGAPPPEGFAAVPGYQAAGVHAGLKTADPDVALLASTRPASAAAVYTTNQVQAAPLTLTREHLADGQAQAVAANSAVANACTGPDGYDDAQAMAQAAADALGIPPEDVLVASTGIIGDPLPVDEVTTGLHHAAKRLDAPGSQAPEALQTTDTTRKTTLATFEAGGETYHVGGVAKGSGMIHPDMATMLGFLATDAPLAPGPLDNALRAAVDETFNMITVDGDTSTNDMVAALANGPGEPIEPRTPAWASFQAALAEACEDLATAVAADGEGATTLLEVQVRGAPELEEAREAARAVAASNLVKDAVFGRDPNWGRVLAALGASPATVDPDVVDVALRDGAAPVPVVANGAEHPEADREALEDVLASEAVTVEIDLGDGPAEATAWGCDLTFDYVDVNANYRT
jgi:glutamate N-acetyltransferase/amino-acid N-acetyltransferase